MRVVTCGGIPQRRTAVICRIACLSSFGHWEDVSQKLMVGIHEAYLTLATFVRDLRAYL